VVDRKTLMGESNLSNVSLEHEASSRNVTTTMTEGFAGKDIRGLQKSSHVCVNGGGVLKTQREGY